MDASIHNESMDVNLYACPHSRSFFSFFIRNPHIPGQRLKVQVPKDTIPGGTFKVTVPLPEDPDDPEDEEGLLDKNKFSRDMQELLDTFCRIYDDWCDAQGRIQPDFAVHAEKRQKFEMLAKEFPDNMVTPVDATYLKKVVRRARQNRQKRSKTAAARQQQLLHVGGGSVSSGGVNSNNNNNNNANIKEDDGEDDPTEDSPPASDSKKKTKGPYYGDPDQDNWTTSTKIPIAVPDRGTVFATHVFDVNDFPA